MQPITAIEERYFHRHRVLLLTLRSWREFPNYIIQTMMDMPGFVWRGQENSLWHLESTFDRHIRDHYRPDQDVAEIATKHLERFKYSIRGRISNGPNLFHLENNNDNISEDEWWALGQHHGLVTPLLDWTKSPFVALFFAFLADNIEGDYRAVYALNKPELENLPGGGGLRFINPFIGDNPRLINQSGLFTRTPYRTTVDDWLMTNIIEPTPDQDTIEDEDYLPPTPLMIKILIPNVGRDDCLTALNRMNINQKSIFPDIGGASDFCNSCLRIRSYDDVDEETGPELSFL